MGKTKTDHQIPPPPEDQSGEQISAEPAGSGSPIKQNTSNDVSGKRLTKLFKKKNWDFFSKTCPKASRNGRVALITVKIRLLGGFCSSQAFWWYFTVIFLWSFIPEIDEMI